MNDQGRMYARPSKRISEMSDEELQAWAAGVVGQFDRSLDAPAGPRSHTVPPADVRDTEVASAEGGHDPAPQDSRDGGVGVDIPAASAAEHAGEPTPADDEESEREVALDDPPEYDRLLAGMPGEPKAFGHVRHIEFLDREGCDMLHLSRTGVAWEALFRLTEGGYYYSGVDEVRRVKHPWAFFVNAVRDDCWGDIRMTGISQAHARSLLRASGGGGTG